MQAIATSTSLYIMGNSPTLTRERGRLHRAAPLLVLLTCLLLGLLRKLEGDEGGSRRHLFQLWEQCRKQDCGVGAPSAWHQDVLLTIDGIADNAGAHSRA